MSMKTWINAHYPVSAERFRNASWVRALKSSIKKWEGLRSEACKKHYVVMDWENGVLQGSRHDDDDEDILYFDDHTCALCQRAHPKDSPHRMSHCDICPLVRNGGNPCAYFDSPYARAQKQRSPKPMLAALRTCLRKELAIVRRRKRKK